jgi:bile acid:Na+ symporter, BASS family
VDALLQLVTKLSVLAFVIACMAMMGLSLTLQQIAAPLRKPRLVVAALVANFGVVPFIAYPLVKVFRLDPSYAIGLLLLAGAAGAPFLPKLAELAKGDIAFSVALMILLTVGSIVFLPLALPLLIPGVRVDAWSIARPLLVLMMLPLVIGMVLRTRRERFSLGLKVVLSKVSNCSLILLTILLIGRNWRILADTVGSGAVAAAALFILVSLAVGYLLGGSDPRIRSVLGLGTAQRNIAAALVIATSNFPDPKVVAMLLVATIVGLIVLLIAAARFRRPAEPARNALSHPE